MYFLLYGHADDDVFYCCPKISEDSTKIVRRSHERCRTFPKFSEYCGRLSSKGRHTRWDQSLRLVASFELAIFASKSSRRDQLWSLRLVPRIQTSLNFWDKSLRPVPRCKLFAGLVAGTSPHVCADLTTRGCCDHTPTNINISIWATAHLPLP